MKIEAEILRNFITIESAIILITLIFILLPEIDIPFIKVNLSNLLIPLLPLLYFLISKESFKKTTTLFKNEIIIALLFYLYVISLSIFSPFPLTALKYSLKLLEFLPVFILSLMLFSKKDQIYILILFLGILLCLLNIILFIYPQLYKNIFYERPSTYPRMQSLVGHPNPFAFSLLISLLILFSFLKENKISIKGFMLIYILFVANLILTGSKNIFIVFILVSLYFIYDLMKEKRKFLSFFVLLTLLISSILFYNFWIRPITELWSKVMNMFLNETQKEQIVKEIPIKYSSEAYQGGSIGLRGEIYKKALEIIKEFPLGIGPYVFQSEFLKNHPLMIRIFGEGATSLNAHNIILQTWLDFGLISFLLILGIIYLIMKTKSFLKHYWVILLISNLGDYFLNNPFILYLTIIFLGFSLGELKYEKNSN
jgi:O-antigen ligase